MVQVLSSSTTQPETKSSTALRGLSPGDTICALTEGRCDLDPPCEAFSAFDAGAHRPQAILAQAHERSVLIHGDFQPSSVVIVGCLTARTLSRL